MRRSSRMQACEAARSLTGVLYSACQFALCRTFQSESRSRASEEEARFYLEDNRWNIGAALQQYREDCEWERVQAAGGGKTQPMHATQVTSGKGGRFF